MSLRQNIPLLYVVQSLMWVRFYIPVFALFYIASQVSFEQFSIIMGVYALVMIVFEVPSGVFADFFGKKKTLLISKSLFLIQLFVVAFCNGFWPLLLAQVVAGIAGTLSSGTEEAFLYDTLRKLGRTGEHKRISGNLYAVTNTTKAFVFVLGGFLFALNPKWPALFSLPFNVLALVLVCFFTEPTVRRTQLRFKQSFSHLKKSCQEFMHYKTLKYLALFSLPVNAVVGVVLSSSSSYFEQIQIPVVFVGVLAFASSLVVAFSSKLAHAVEQRLGDRASLLLVQFFLFAGLVLLSLMAPFIGVAFYFLIPLAAGFSGVLINHYMNLHVGSKHRVTMLSIKNLADNVGVAVAFPLFGYATKTYSMSIAWALFAGVFLVYALLLSFWKQRRC